MYCQEVNIQQIMEVRQVLVLEVDFGQVWFLTCE